MLSAPVTGGSAGGYASTASVAELSALDKMSAAAVGRHSGRLSGTAIAIHPRASASYRKENQKGYASFGCPPNVKSVWDIGQQHSVFSR